MWPQFVPAAVRAGFASVHAVPVRVRDTVLGTLGLFARSSGRLSDEDLELAQALAYVAGVAIVQDKAAADRNLLNEQLQTALDSRVVLEQAKGVLAQRGGLQMDQAFRVLRGYARDHNRRLTDTARAVASRELPAELVLDHAGARRLRPPVH
jgi:GAF domain-containing protein